MHPPSNFTNYSAYLFDMDGTLVDSERLKGKALTETCELFGGSADINIYKTVMGEKWEIVTSHFFHIAKISPNFEVFNAKFKVIYQNLLRKELKANPNAIKLLKYLKIKGKKLGLVSSASEWMVNHALEQLNLSHFFDIVICKELVNKHKPNPEPYLLALRKLGLPSSKVLIFEDSNVGLLAAQKANCNAIAFRHKFNTNNDLSLSLKIISDYNEIFIQ